MAMWIKKVEGEPMKEGCAGYRIGNPIDGYDFTCGYEHSGDVDCEDCIFGVFGRPLDPRKSSEERKKNE